MLRLRAGAAHAIVMVDGHLAADVLDRVDRLIVARDVADDLPLARTSVGRGHVVDHVKHRKRPRQVGRVMAGLRVAAQADRVADADAARAALASVESERRERLQQYLQLSVCVYGCEWWMESEKKEITSVPEVAPRELPATRALLNRVFQNEKSQQSLLFSVKRLTYNGLKSFSLSNSE